MHNRTDLAGCIKVVRGLFPGSTLRASGSWTRNLLSDPFKNLQWSHLLPVSDATQPLTYLQKTTPQTNPPPRSSRRSSLPLVELEGPAGLEVKALPGAEQASRLKLLRIFHMALKKETGQTMGQEPSAGFALKMLHCTHCTCSPPAQVEEKAWNCCGVRGGLKIPSAFFEDGPDLAQNLRRNPKVREHVTELRNTLGIGFAESS